MDLGLRGKVALVTGGSRGIGRALALALELGDAGIRVDTVCPGSILFPGGGWDRFRQDEPDAFHAFAGREFPARRLGSSEEAADAVTFLVSDRASWINGAMIRVDGAQGRPRPF